MAKTGVTIYHNPRCGKSRQTLARIQEAGIEPAVVHYLEDPPSKATIKGLLKLLKLAPIDLIRRKEDVAKTLEIGKKDYSDAALIDLMAKHPILIERPIVVRGNRAVLGRPPENVDALL